MKNIVSVQLVTESYTRGRNNSRFRVLNIFEFLLDNFESVSHTLFELSESCDAQLLLDLGKLLLLFVELLTQLLDLILKLKAKKIMKSLICCFMAARELIPAHTIFTFRLVPQAFYMKVLSSVFTCSAFDVSLSLSISSWVGSS